MTTIKVSKKNGKYQTITVKGHTGYDIAGHDIVCAGISTLVQSTARGLVTFVSDKITFELYEEPPFYKIVIPDNLATSQYLQAKLLLDSMVLSLEDFASEYPKNLKMEVKNDVY